MTYRVSMYDKIIDEFLQSRRKYHFPFLDDKRSSYIQAQLAKRIKIRKLEDKVKVSILGNGVMLENKKIDLLLLRPTIPK